MSVYSPGATQLRFGTFEVDLESRELRRAGIRIRLQPQSFEILVVLALRPGEIVTRAELRERLWPPGTFVDFENSMNAAVKRLRIALGDDASTPRFIETVPRQGYRMIAGVVEISPAAEPVPPLPEASEEKLRSKPSRAMLLVVVVALLLLCVGVYLSVRRSYPGSPQRILLAVLPFEGSGGDDYSNAVVTEDLITELGRLKPSALGVIARTSAMHYATGRETIATIGHDLGVAYVVEGSVTRTPARVHISSRLIQVSDQTELWAHTYESDPQNILKLQSELAQGVADEINRKVPSLGLPHTSLIERHSTSAEAEQLYMKGRYYWRRRYGESLKVSQAAFEQAIRLDAGYALAYAGLADTYFLLAISGEAPADSVMPLARSAALKAVSLDPQSAEAHTSLAQVLANYDRDWAGAEREYRHAIELNSNYSTAHHWYATFLMNMGRSNEAIAELTRALEVDPLSSIERTFRAKALYYNREYDKAIAEYRSTLTVDPGFAVASSFLVQTYEQVGRFDEAIGEYRREIPLSGGSPQAAATYADQLAGAVKAHGAEGYWRKRLELTAPGSWLEKAAIFARLGQNDQAFQAMETAYKEHDMWLVAMRVEPKWDNIRSDRRFASMLQREGLMGAPTR